VWGYLTKKSCTKLEDLGFFARLDPQAYTQEQDGGHCLRTPYTFAVQQDRIAEPWILAHPSCPGICSEQDSCATTMQTLDPVDVASS
jgi:mannose-6-phosphate isomerase class I